MLSIILIAMLCILVLFVYLRNKQIKEKEKERLDRYDKKTMESMSERIFEVETKLHNELIDLEKYKRNFTKRDKGLRYTEGAFISDEYKPMWIPRKHIIGTIDVQIKTIEESRKNIRRSRLIHKSYDHNLDEFQIKISDYRNNLVSSLGNKIDIFNDYLDSRIKLLERYKTNIIDGEIGEEYVYKTIKDFDNCNILRNVKIEFPDNEGKLQSIEMDFVLIMETGVFVLEVKNYGSKGQYDLVVDKSGRWMSRYKNGTEYVLDGANAQNNRHLMFLNRYLNDTLEPKEYLRANGLIVIGNNKINVLNESDLQVIKRADEVYNYVTSFPKTLDKCEMDNIVKAISDARRPREPKYPLANLYDETLENIKEIDKELEKYNTILKNTEMFLE